MQVYRYILVNSILEDNPAIEKHPFWGEGRVEIFRESRLSATETELNSCCMGPLTHLIFPYYKHNCYIAGVSSSRCSAPTHWLVHGHMTSNNETVSRQMPWASNIAKTMTSNGKQFTVTREMLTAVAGISARYSKFGVGLFCYITNHLMTGPLGKSEFCFPRISKFPSTVHWDSRETKFTTPLGTSHYVFVLADLYSMT